MDKTHESHLFRSNRSSPRGRLFIHRLNQRLGPGTHMQEGLLQFSRRHRLTEEIALKLVTGVGSQEFALIPGFHRVGYNVEGRLLSCPRGAPKMGHCGVAVLGKGLPFPVHCALHWPIFGALKRGLFMGQCTGLSGFVGEEKQVTDFNSVDEVLDFAIGLEQDAAEFYLQLAEKMAKPEMKTVFEEYADEEKRHKEKLIKLKSEGGGKIAVRDVLDLKISEYTLDIEPSADMELQDALLFVMKREKAAANLYADLAAKVEDEAIRGALELLAHEEAEHKLYFEAEYDNLLTDN